MLVALTALFCLLMSPFAARADGFIIISPTSTPVPVPPGHFSFAPLEVSFHHVTVEINDQVAVTSVDQEFVNPNSQRLEGTYMFPLPSGAHIDRFSMDVNGRMQEAELLPADKARAIYEEIVRSARDPALLEYIGRDAFKVRIFPIEPHSKKRVQIKYTQLLKSDTGLIEYTYPLNTEKFSARPLHNVSVKINVNSTEPLKSVYCPTHSVEIKRDGGNKAVVGYEERNVRPDADFKLIFSREKANDIGINLLTYKSPHESDGYFLLLASPGMEVKNAPVQPKDICFVMDTSGSMSAKKMDQAKKAMAFCLSNLNEQDRFEIIRFSTEAEPFFEGLQPANKQNVDKAQAFIQTLKPIGGTAIDDALQKALKLNDNRRIAGQARPYVVIFLTDGQPTIGETNIDSILANVGKANPQQVRVFSFGIGTDVNTHLLDRMAESTKSFSQYVLPEEDIEVKLSNFYTKIKDPVLSDVQVAFTGQDIKVTQVYPSNMPDLFKGEMLVVFGKYSGKGAAAAKVSGMLAGQKKDFATDVNFTENDAKHEFIPRLWATRRVGWLLDEIRKNGETKETKEEVVRLARQHGIVTPYTAYLILEDEARRGVPVAVRTFRELEADAPARDAAKALYDSTADARRDTKLQAGDVAVANSANIEALKRGQNVQQSGQDFALDKAGRYSVNRGAGVGGGASFGGVPATTAAGAAASQPEPAELYSKSDGSLGLRARTPAQGLGGNEAKTEAQGYRASSNYANQARVIKGKAFYQNGTTWTDAAAQEKKDLRKREVKFNSDEYFALLKENPDIASWLALGNEVDLVLGEELVVVR
jgi:Ca-activated chloride channel family protein